MKRKNEQEKSETQVLIEAAVAAAVEASMRGIDEKIEAAVNLGVTIGATAGACLLYTSPSPRDGLLSRMQSSA